MKRLKLIDFGDHVWCSPPHLCPLLHAYKEKKQKSLVYSVCDDFFVSYLKNLSLIVLVLNLFVYSMKELVCVLSHIFSSQLRQRIALKLLVLLNLNATQYWMLNISEKIWIQNTNVKSTFNWIWMRLNIGQSWTFQNKYISSQCTLFKETTSLL